MAPPLSSAGPRGQPTLTIPLPLSQRGQHFGEPPSQRRMLRQLHAACPGRAPGHARSRSMPAGQMLRTAPPAHFPQPPRPYRPPTRLRRCPLVLPNGLKPPTTRTTLWPPSCASRGPATGAAIRRAVKFAHRDALPAALAQLTASDRVLAQRIEAGGIRYGLPCHRCGISRRQPARRWYCDRCPMRAGSDALAAHLVPHPTRRSYRARGGRWRYGR